MHWAIYSFAGFEGASAVAEGLSRIGDRASFKSLHDFLPGQGPEPVDAVMIYGLQHKGEEIRRTYRAAGIPVVIIDYGYMRRVHAAHNWRTGYWQISPDELNAIDPGPVDSSRFDALGLEVHEVGGDPDGYALFLGQTSGDKSHNLTNEQMKLRIHALRRQFPDLLIRPHPLDAELNFGLPVASATTLEGALDGARIAYTFNSNAGLDALMFGVPVMTLVAGAAYRSLTGSRLPSRADRLALLHRAAWSQWTWQEMREGLPLKRLKSRLNV